MLIYPIKKINRIKTSRGRGLINNIINSLPFELHLPGYKFCGPGTRIDEKISNKVNGINKLDEACKTHDIFYSKNKDITQRHQADRELLEKAWERVKSKDSSIGEKINSYIVTNVMKGKVKMGLGVRNLILKNGCEKKMFNNAVKKATNVLKKEKPEDLAKAIKLVKKSIKQSFGKNKSKVITPRVLKVPKFGGKLENKLGGMIGILPILSALSAVGALTSGASGIAKALNSAKNAKQQLEEATRHNKTMESIAIGKGLYLKPYKKGLGISYGITQTKNY